MATLVTLTALAASIGQTYAQSALTVNTASTLQQIDGFGVSQAFGRAAEFRDMLSGDPQKQGLDYLFNTTTGAGLTIIRNRIGSGTTNSDSILPKSPGGPSAAANYSFDDDDRGQVWFSQQAMKYGVKTIYADAWSAPGFMKTNNNENNGGYLCGTPGHSCSSGDWRQPYADFLVQYVKYYSERGIPITQLGFLNEPDYVTSYSSMQSGANEAASFIPILHDTLEANGLGNVSITCCDAMGWNSQRSITQGLVSAGMEKYLGYITSHMYTGDPNSVISTKLKTWQTEAADLQSRWCATWYGGGGQCEGFTWAQKIHNGLANANLSAYIYWQGVEVNQFQASSYLVASDGKTLTPSGRLWAFAMWSRFVRPGAYRVSTSGSVSSTGITAFKNADGSVVVVFLNSGGSQQSVKVSFKDFTPAAAEAFVTDNTRSVASVESTLADGTVTVSVPSRGMLTVKLTAAS
ncbi:glycoside hydrolase family 30 protein [Daldinia vernicosa]|uniref:glycoside hydrolase family 30 protein n=1 Tax=Daldinia vernicosa TaxID=114800 RepID=UPI0020079C10|nr:glycoside hydrolase family 30 protein [Daldinia vernicosa]KAI0846208.1 glycoside hydrolase family 30 protein [Daldinia vernicosa]